jgi:hypothetical protein
MKKTTKTNDMICCGSERKTPYCPQCGKQLLSSHPLSGLQNHCRAQANRLREESIKCKETADRCEYGDGHTEYNRKRATSSSHRSDKWQAWADALAEVINAP